MSRKGNKNKTERTAKEVAYLALMTALLLGGQFALSAVSGVEVVTVLLLCFSYTFGAQRGAIVATAFSLLRCLLFGFFPYVVVLYLVYFNLFALLFGLLGARKSPLPVWVCPALLSLIGGCSLYFAIVGIPVDFERDRLAAMLWTLFGLICAVLVLYVVLVCCGRKRGAAGRELASVTALASACTVFFTLLDDVLWPLFAGLSGDGALAYFYNGFFAMIPQTICTVVTVSALFFPLRKIFSFAAKKL